MHRVTAAIPRLTAIGVLTASVVVQRRRSGKQPKTAAETRGSPGGVATRAAATLTPSTAASAGSPVRLMGAAFMGGSLSTALVRTVFLVLQRMWLSVAIGAAASLATVNAKVAASLKQLQVAAPSQVAQVPVLDAEAVQAFCGRWAKVGARSDPMDKFCELFGVPKWLRQATRLMTGMHIYIVDDTLVVKQICKLGGWVSAVETFPLDGSCSTHKRRDMRSGKQTGQLLEAAGDSMTVRVCWQGSMAGSAVDTLQLQETPQGTQLVVFHKAHLEGRGTAEFKEVFRASR